MNIWFSINFKVTEKCCKASFLKAQTVDIIFSILCAYRIDTVEGVIHVRK